jgi:hypothetical protein
VGECKSIAKKFEIKVVSDKVEQKPLTVSQHPL